MEALLIGYEGHLLWQLPALLSRVGFTVDVISNSTYLKRSQYIRSVFNIPHPSSATNEIIQQLDKKNYSWIIITQDQILQEVVNSNISDEIKCRILPVTSSLHFNHISSKIGLSHTLCKAGILTPKFRVITKLSEAEQALHELSPPVFFKVDASCGGRGVYELSHKQQCKKLIKLLKQGPMLAQEKIFGTEIDLSALFFEGKLIHFSYSIPVKSVYNHGPSSLRYYFPLKYVDPEIFQELTQLGKALGANGFVTISCIERPDKKRFYIEADMRPNAWVDFTQFIGDDAAPMIRAWLASNSTLTPSTESKDRDLSTFKPILIPHFLRTPLLSLLINHNKVWKYIPNQDTALISILLFKKIIQIPFLEYIRNFIPQNLRQQLKRYLRFYII
ncbi:MAG: hypothetical protein K0S08_279 [Gammaproteobacteria bacterium]|jgi:hypothetical protein|nr:hypothetical protein [Gammaproteobacteria bacterium]